MHMIVNLTNRLAILTVVIFFYFIFAAILMSVFGLRVFQENMTAAFYFSIFAMVLFLAACLMLNVMGNLTLISRAVNTRLSIETPQHSERNHTLIGALLLVALVAIPSLLFLGDRLTTIEKEKRIIKAAGKLSDEYKETLTALSDYDFNFDYIKKAQNSLNMMNKVEESFPHVDMIVKDKIGDQDVFLAMQNHSCCDDSDIVEGKKKEPQKSVFIFKTSSEERAYLASVFDNSEKTPRYSSSDGKYELYYPLEINGKRIVLYLTEYSSYGKVGS